MLAARQVVQRLQELLSAGEGKPEDVAILTRAASSFSAYEDALDAAGIPFLTLAGQGFYQRPEIRDLVVVMRAAADPSDDVALAGALRSPGLGLSDVSLYHLAQARRTMQDQAAAEQTISLWQALPQALAKLDEAEAQRGQRAMEIITQLNQLAGRVRVADLLKRYLDETDYLAILAGAGQDRALRNVSKLVEEVRRANFVQVDDFVEYVKLARAASVREGEAPVVAEDAVQIMTVHRAKGLEFPIVILGDISYHSMGRNNLLLAAGHIAWNPSSLPGKDEKPVFFNTLKSLEQRKDEAESKRLLYVAATRAREMLLVNGVVGGRTGNQGWMKFLTRAVPQLKDLGGKNANPPQDFITQLPGSSISVRCVLIDEQQQLAWPQQGAESQRQPPVFDARMLQSIAEEQVLVDEKLQAAEEKPERRIWRVLPRTDSAWAPSWVVGALVHRAIELERFPDDPRFDDWFRASARGLGLSDEKMLANALSRARKTLSRLQRSEFWRQIVTADQRMHEIPYTFSTPDGHLQRGTIDLAWQKDGQWQLVDFKTDRVQTRAEMQERIADKYLAQMQRYIRAMQEILQVTPTAWICFLDVGGHIELEQISL